MATSQREIVAAEIATVLATITAAAGYDHTVVRVYRNFREPRAVVHGMPYLCVIDGPDRKATGHEGGPNQYYEVTGQWTIWGFERVGDLASATFTPSTVMNSLIASIEKALLAAATLKGGNVAGSVVDHLHLRGSSHGLWGNQEPVGICEVRIECVYQHRDDVAGLVNGPYTGRG